ncbi:MAG: pirin-like C-terminal cupin domain-containing protein, partial [Acidimicrobiia bacterium]|nr:pirin-like C-terminal cupin domain-containing protein [Acidimicrobiia bacterium]
IAGAIDGVRAPSPPPDSWAARPESDMAIWLIRLDEGAKWDVPPAPGGVNRMLHFFDGDEAGVDATSIRHRTGARLDPERTTRITNLGGPAEFLLLQGRPIGAPVFQMGPFVMNTPEQLQQAFADYRRTQFGGWPWPNRSHVHARREGRFALHVDGTIERRDMQPVG